MTKREKGIFNAFASTFVNPFSPIPGYGRLAATMNGQIPKYPSMEREFILIIDECKIRIEECINDHKTA
jgi:hypothetical protein